MATWAAALPSTSPYCASSLSSRPCSCLEIDLTVISPSNDQNNPVELELTKHGGKQWMHVRKYDQTCMWMSH